MQTRFVDKQNRVYRTQKLKFLQFPLGIAHSIGQGTHNTLTVAYEVAQRL